MKFKLLIECTKDIDELSINFTDGTSVVKESKHVEEENSGKHTRLQAETSHHNDNHVRECDNNWFEESPNANSTNTVLPKVELPVREGVKIAQELQNLDI